MSDLYHHQYSRNPFPQPTHLPYPAHLPPQPPSSLQDTDDDDHSHVTPTPPQPSTPRSDHSLPKPEGKPQATFLTKLYALLERPENHHMIRWDAEGKHIIVERPEQLALHVLPSIYRQSRFASFSRQLNIYGFMRKVNLRNVDPSIDDPDASTWSHPTLDRNSPPEVVANFKRRVPPRLPKPKRRPDAMNDPNNAMIPPRSAVGMGVPLTVPSSIAVPSSAGVFQRGRSRGFSAPSAFNPLTHTAVSSPGQWNGPSYPPPRNPLPPLTVPSDSPAHLSHGSLYGPTAASHIPPITPTDDTPQTSVFSPGGYSASTGSPSYHNYPQSSMGSHPSYGYANSEPGSNWNFPPLNTAGSAAASGGHSSLSSLLNPTSNYGARPSIQTSYPSHHHQPYSAAASLANNQSPVSLSPDSRPTTGYSVASSLSYDQHPPSGEYDSRPGSSQHVRPMTPISRHSPTLKTGPGAYGSGLSVRRERRHSHAVSPYPSPYDSMDGRPMTAPGHPDSPPGHPGGPIPRVKSLMHVASTGGQSGDGSSPYGYQPAAAEFAYSAGAGAAAMDSPERSWISPSHEQQQNNGANHSIRPSTSTSSLSAASQSSASATNTPPAIMDGGHYPDSDININRFLNQSRPNSESNTHME